MQGVKLGSFFQFSASCLRWDLRKEVKGRSQRHSQVPEFFSPRNLTSRARSDGMIP